MNASTQEPQQLIELLNDTFDESFSLWQQVDANWVHWCGDDERLSEARDRLHHDYDVNAPVLAGGTQSRTMMIIPIDGIAIDPVAVVAFPQQTASLDRMVKAAHQLLRHHIQVARQGTLIEELTQSMEEGYWLRELSRHLELSEMNQPVDALARQLLPQLRDLIHAATIGFVPLGVSPLEAVWIGDAVDPVSCARIIEEHCEAALTQPVVINKDGINPNLVPLTSDRFGNLILVPVNSHRSQFGWLMALNRPDVSVQELVMRPSESQFGTVEASLMETAGIMLATHANNMELFQAKERLVVGVIEAMSGAIDARDAYTRGHSDRVARFARRIAEEMGFSDDQTERIYLTGLLHDVGKIGVPDDVLLKEGKLTDAEFDAIKRHPEIGHQILRELDELSFVLPGVLHHHERIDGTGYPHRLVGDDIPLEARILSVADAYDAMTSNRPYRDSMPTARAEAIISAGAGSQFDAEVVRAFFAALPDIHAIGAMQADEQPDEATEWVTELV